MFSSLERKIETVAQVIFHLSVQVINCTVLIKRIRSHSGPMGRAGLTQIMFLKY